MASPADVPLFSTEQQTAINATVADLTSGPYSDVNTGFILASAYLVFFMHCGFAMISVGSVRSRFAKHISILILLDACASAFGFYITGYAFAYGDNVTEDGTFNGNPFIGTRFFALDGLAADQFHLWFFQWTFAATACTIVSGAIAERARFEAYFMYSLFMASWVYPIVVHSIWSPSGWASAFRPASMSRLVTSGAIDFAGSGAVHMVGGLAAAAGCYILGPRLGRFTPDGGVTPMPGHNSSLFVLGVMILWFGWYGFNPGSQLALVGVSSAVSNAAVTTTLAPAMSGMSALLVQGLWVWFTDKRVVYDIMTMGNGALAGLVAITAGCSVVYPWGAICIGIIAGAVYVVGSRVSLWAKLDDPLDAIAVHAWNGTWGVIAVGLFAGKNQVFNSYGSNPRSGGEDQADYYRHYGAFLGGKGYLLAAQLIYALWIFGWVLGMMLPFFALLKYFKLFRVPENQEMVGLDASYHGGPAYDNEIDNESMHNAGRLPKTVANGNGVAMDDTKALMVELADLKRHVRKLETSVAGADRSIAPHVKGLETGN